MSPKKKALARRVYKKVLNIRANAVRTGSYGSIRRNENGELSDFEMSDRQKRHLMARGLWEAREKAKTAREETPIKLAKIANDYASLKGEHLMQRANGLRNEVLAHSAADKKLQVMKDFSDAEKLLERTVGIVD